MRGSPAEHADYFSACLDRAAPWPYAGALAHLIGLKSCPRIPIATVDTCHLRAIRVFPEARQPTSRLDLAPATSISWPTTATLPGGRRPSAAQNLLQPCQPGIEIACALRAKDQYMLLRRSTSSSHWVRSRSRRHCGSNPTDVSTIRRLASHTLQGNSTGRGGLPRMLDPKQSLGNRRPYLASFCYAYLAWPKIARFRCERAAAPSQGDCVYLPAPAPPPGSTRSSAMPTWPYHSAPLRQQPTDQPCGLDWIHTGPHPEIALSKRSKKITP